MSVKKTPMRMCTGCREMKPKKELIRVVKTPEGEIKLDTVGKLNGRGAYICKHAECLKRRKNQTRFPVLLSVRYLVRFIANLKGR